MRLLPFLHIAASLALLFHGGCTASSPSVASDSPAPDADDSAAVEGFISVDSGFAHGCALHSSGQVLCWGHNEQGQVGTEEGHLHHTPTRVTGITDAAVLAVGGNHNCVLHRSGEVSCWGVHHRTGHGTADDDGTSAVGSPHPRRVQAPGGVHVQEGRHNSWCPGDDILRDIVALDASSNHTCAVHAKGQVLCWGGNNRAQSGGASRRYRNLQCPVPVEGISDAAEVFAGGAQTCAVTDDGEVICWGGERTTPYSWRDFDGGQGANRWSEMNVRPQYVDAEEIRLGDKMSCARWADGTTRCVEESSQGQGDEFHPSKDHLLASSPGLETCFLDPSGEMTCHSYFNPKSYTYPPWEEDSPIRAITVPDGSDTTTMAPVCALTEDHRLYCATIMTQDNLPSAAKWEEVTLESLDAPPPVEDQQPRDAQADSSQKNCPQELVLGDPEWPNHLHFERGGLSRTIYFEEVLAEYHDGLGHDPTSLFVAFPTLRVDTSSGDTPRTDGWDSAVVSAPLYDAGESATMHFHYNNPSPRLDCFYIPPTRFGSLTFEESHPPTSENPERGRVAATFETTIGGDESGRLTGAFVTDNVFLDRTFPVDRDTNISKGYPPPGSDAETEELAGTIGRALYREQDDQLTIEFGEEGMLHGRTITNFTGEPGIYLTAVRNTYRFHIDTVEEDRIAGTMDTFIDLPDQSSFSEEELNSMETAPNSPVSMRFDLPLLRVQPPPALHLQDDQI